MSQILLRNACHRAHGGRLAFRFRSPDKVGPIKPLDPISGPSLAAVWLDGQFQAYCPPYYPDMGAAVQAIFDAE